MKGLKRVARATAVHRAVLQRACPARRMRCLATSVALAALATAPLTARAQTPPTSAAPGASEAPLTVRDGRMFVTAVGDNGQEYEFVLGLASGLTAQTAATRMEGVQLTLGGQPISTLTNQVVPDSYLEARGLGGTAGILGGDALKNYDILLDAPGGRILLKPAARTVRWPGHSLSNPVNVTVMHEYLIRADVQVGEAVFGALLDLSPATFLVDAVVLSRSGESQGIVDSFRMGYSGWPSVQLELSDDPTLRGWGGDGTGEGFMLLAAPLAFDCKIAVSWRHSEIRTCLR